MTLIQAPRMSSWLLICLLCCSAFFLSGCSPCGVFSYEQESISFYFKALRLFRQADQAGRSEGEEKRETFDALIEEADEAVLNALRLNPLFSPAHKLAIDFAGFKNDESEILRRLEKALAIFPEDAEIRLAYAKAMVMKEDGAPKAMSLLQDGLAREPRDLMIRQAYAELLAHLNGEAEEIETHMMISFALPDLPEAFYVQAAFFAVSLAQQGMQDTAIRLLMRIAEKSPSGTEFGLDEALRSGLGKTALDLLNVMLQEEAPSPPPALLLSYPRLLIMTDHLKEAEEWLLKEKVQLAADFISQPKRPQAYRAWLKLQEGGQDQAIAELLGILENFPGCYSAIEGLVIAYSQFPGSIEKSRLMTLIKDSLSHLEDPLIQGRLMMILARLSEKS
ncbi:MAG: hypothetical protein KJ645_12940 [Planctomycetes bacterium]|nr:hypothetical protein [Planctomycetota bacterium]